jgi:nudix-type nucleoside diphosphatase (YffH/AdpP family)
MSLDLAAPAIEAVRSGIMKRERVYSGWCWLDRVALRMPDGGIEERHIEHHGHAVAVLPYDPERRVALLVRQPRATVIAAGAPALIEVPAGRIESDHPPDCARREVMEEGGIRLQELQDVGLIWSMPALSMETVRLFLAEYRNPDRIGRGGGAEQENEGIEAFELPLHRLGNLLSLGEIRDAKTVILVQRLMIDQPVLFT